VQEAPGLRDVGSRAPGLRPASYPVPAFVWRAGAFSTDTRAVAEETAIALTFGRSTHAVMMATPADLEDFAVGFSLSEGVIDTPSDIEALDIVPRDLGVELRMTVAPDRMEALVKRRRYLTGATGCGLCGMESLEEAGRLPPIAPMGRERWSASALAGVQADLAANQTLNRATHAAHAAAFWTEHDGITVLREDVGRHNALDKLAGALARAGHDPRTGVVALTSRVSVEMVQKAAMIGAPMLMAVSAPTGLAVRLAERCGITLIGVARADGFEVFTHPTRVVAGAPREDLGDALKGTRPETTLEA
jgi:FdhD protein